MAGCYAPRTRHGQGAGLVEPFLKSRIAEDLSGGAARGNRQRDGKWLWEIPPPLAFTVIVDVPTVAVLLALKVSVELPEPGAAIDVD